METYNFMYEMMPDFSVSRFLVDQAHVEQVEEERVKALHTGTKREIGRQVSTVHHTPGK
jgi:hypothetical protein